MGALPADHIPADVGARRAVPLLVLCHKPEAVRQRRRRGDLGGIEGLATLAGCAVAPGITSVSGTAMERWSDVGARREIASPCAAFCGGGLAMTSSNEKLPRYRELVLRQLGHQTSSDW